jgi:NAD(P)-dependent dehydrogenase (short-subunit alcohol dehydrogenase family)
MARGRKRPEAVAYTFDISWADSRDQLNPERTTKTRKTVFTLLALVLIVSGGGIFADEASKAKAVLVTGASSGIGLQIVETLSRNGFCVYAGARKAEDLKMLDAMDNVSAVRLDVNVFGPFRINQAFLPMLLESNGRTSIIGSISGYIPDASDGGYVASKFAVEGYTDSLAMELAGTGVYVGIVEPGGYKSQIRDKFVAQALTAEGEGDFVIDDETRKSLMDYAASNEAMKDPVEVADAVLLQMSSDAPKRRYMVTPNAEQAALTIRFAMQRMLQLNEGQPYSYSRDELVALLDELLKTK